MLIKKAKYKYSEILIYKKIKKSQNHYTITILLTHKVSSMRQ